MSRRREPAFYLLSLKHSDERSLQWWAPNGSGYVRSLNDAGRYTRAQIDEQPERYNDGFNVIAVPCGAADADARGSKDRVVPSESLEFMKRATRSHFTIAPYKKIVSTLEGRGGGDWLECGHFKRRHDLAFRWEPKKPAKQRRCEKCPRIAKSRGAA